MPKTSGTSGTPRKTGTCLPYFDLMIKFDVLFMSVAPGTVVLNIIYEGLWLVILSIMMKR